MAVIRNLEISNDEFDLIDPEPVSDMSDPESAGPHGKKHNLPAQITPQPTESVTTKLPIPGTEDQRTYASTLGTNKPNTADVGQSPGEGIPGLNYTKSAIQKMWGTKDALIAVMG
ncbi:hypothetical protein PG993_000167 [Apiospora rasikravindrae]|uniref:Uncharacterized protein n=1 Tax=Apiospora rasikravindrae TaxID=990691 RepID=A0ABR1U7U5_9PEZI